jgi:hypothetical protein
LLIGGFVAAAFGFMTGTRFAATVVLLLQVGMAAIIVRFAESPQAHTDKFKLALAGAAFGTLLFQALAMGLFYFPHQSRFENYYGNVYVHALALTSSIPDDEPVAAYDVAAWPISASGQKVLSIPWPEPMIPNLSERQAEIKQLFDPDLTRADRAALARSYGVRTLILDQRYSHEGFWPYWAIVKLSSQAKSVEHSGPMIRFDLY